MFRSAAIGVLIVLNLWAVACALNPLYVEVSDSSPFLHAITEPEEWIRPWGPPLLLAILFALLGSRRTSKVVARIGAAVAFYCGLFWIMIIYSFAGFFAMDDVDSLILLISLSITATFGWWGFSRDPEREPHVTPSAVDA